MRLPKDKLTEVMKKPRLFLCEVNKEKICELETTSLSGNFKFNAYSELTCTVPRKYTNITTGDTQVNPHYDRIEALRLIYLEGFGYFEIQDPEIVSDGVKEIKNITAYSLEYTLSQKYLDNIKINTGEVDSVEVIESNGGLIIPVTLYNQQNPKLSLLDIVLEKVYGWKIGHIDESLKTMGRTFEISRVSVYDFIVQDICEKFNCFAVFDTISNTINLYAESLITKHIGDGETTIFLVNPPYDQISSVSIDGYRTTSYTYDSNNGKLTLETAPPDGSKIEIVDGSQTKWITDVYVTFENLAQEVNISYSAEDIKTVLTVKGSNDLDIREVNMGLPYIVDLSYYYSVDWMGQDLYDAYTKYLQVCDNYQDQYASNSKKMLDIKGHITYEKQRLSLQYSIAENVNSSTVGTYYVRGGADPDYYYTEVSLPDEYDANVKHYYTLSGTDLNEEKFSNLYKALQTYFTSDDEKNINDISELSESFAFMIENTIDILTSKLSTATNLTQKNEAILSFFDEMWNQLGSVPLDTLYYKPYKKIEQTNIEAGWNDVSNANYWLYYPVTLVLSSLEDEKTQREATIQALQNEYNELEKENNQFASQSSIYNNFTPMQLIRLSAFLREDEYTDTNFEELSTDTIESLMQKKQELLECGRIELSKLCEPKLEFSMNMANIYALPEFEPIIDQFQLGNLINVAIRDDYIKRARLLEVNINFDDFPDFSCSFGELTNLKTPSSIHADLLATALTAGKSVASNASYWNKGVDIATQLDLKIQDGLISAIGGLYNKDQSVKIDDMGILLRKLNEDGTYSPYQAWIRNNTILLSEDGFSETSEPSLGLGEFVVDGKTFYGILAKAILSGYIEGSTIVGGKINIGDGTFIVDEAGHVTMKASSIDGYVEEDNIISSINQSPESIAINANKISLAGKAIDLTTDDISINSTNFSVTKEGKVTATSGDIAGWKITNSYIDSTVTGSKQRLCLASASDSSDYWIAAMDSDGGRAFYISKKGKLYSRNAEIEGKITAFTGEVGGWDIAYNSLTNVYNGYGIGFCNESSAINLIAAGIPVGADDDITTMSWAEAPFRVTRDGSVYATKGLIGGWKITSSYIDSTVSDSNRRLFLASASDTSDSWMGARDDNGNYVFVLSKTGKLYASNAEIAGKITATSGKIGGFDLNTYSLDCTKDGKRAIINSNSIGISGNVVFGVYDGSKWSAYIDGAGKLVSTNADISGKITATSGSIAAACIPDLDASKITSGTISTSRLSSSVITTSNFSTKTLSTTELTIKAGCTLGATTYNAVLENRSGYIYISAKGPTSYGTTIHEIVRQAASAGSSRDIKNEIHDFDDRYDLFFDKLNPQLYKYNFEPNEGYSMGYIWQDIEQALNEANLTRNDVGAVYESEAVTGGLGLRKEDFIALNTWQIQKLKARVEELEKKLATLEA